jgi:uncharacterized membrane protein YeaQ/YmgE (transglycosylase-associated protein family)
VATSITVWPRWDAVRSLGTHRLLYRDRTHTNQEEDATTMGILAWIVLGLIAGAIAKAIMPGDDPGGIIITILIGIVGAIIGGFMWTTLTGAGGVSGLNIGSILIAILGSIVLLAAYRLVIRGRTT